MEDLFVSLTNALAAWVEAVTGTPVAPEAFRVPRAGGQLSLGAFVTGNAEEAARKLTADLPVCPWVRVVEERNGWLLFYLSDAWFDRLIAWARGLGTRPTGSYAENRMAMLMRKGDGPCPDAEPVRRALWASYLAFRRGLWRTEDERLILTMTHGPTGTERVALENRCGSVAAAICKLRGEKL